jgi:hypothetical protein
VGTGYDRVVMLYTHRVVFVCHGRYQADEGAARAEGLGIWSGRIELP